MTVEAAAKRLADVVSNVERNNQGGGLTILTDLASGRRGWYHDMLNCFIDVDGMSREELRDAALKAAEALKIVLPESCYEDFYGV